MCIATFHSPFLFFSIALNFPCLHYFLFVAVCRFSIPFFFFYYFFFFLLLFCVPFMCPMANHPSTQSRGVRCDVRDDQRFSAVRYMTNFRSCLDTRRFVAKQVSGDAQTVHNLGPIGEHDTGVGTWIIFWKNLIFCGLLCNGSDYRMFWRSFIDTPRVLMEVSSWLLLFISCC